MKKTSNKKPVWRIPLNMVTNAGRRIYKGIQGAVFTMTKGGNKNYKVPKSGLKYKPVNIRTSNNVKTLFKPKY